MQTERQNFPILKFDKRSLSPMPCSSKDLNAITGYQLKKRYTSKREIEYTHNNQEIATENFNSSTKKEYYYYILESNKHLKQPFDNYKNNEQNSEFQIVSEDNQPFNLYKQSPLFKQKIKQLRENNQKNFFQIDQQMTIQVDDIVELCHIVKKLDQIVEQSEDNRAIFVKQKVTLIVKMFSLFISANKGIIAESLEKMKDQILKLILIKQSQEICSLNKNKAISYIELVLNPQKSNFSNIHAQEKVDQAEKIIYQNNQKHAQEQEKLKITIAQLQEKIINQENMYKLNIQNMMQQISELDQARLKIKLQVSEQEQIKTQLQKKLVEKDQKIQNLENQIKSRLTQLKFHDQYRNELETQINEWKKIVVQQATKDMYAHLQTLAEFDCNQILQKIKGTISLNDSVIDIFNKTN